jgi:hypothetical protein
MARYSRLQVLNTVVELGLVPVFYNPDLEVAKQIVAACGAGGARVVEFTNRGDFAFQVFTALAQHAAEAAPDAILGVDLAGRGTGRGDRESVSGQGGRRAGVCQVSAGALPVDAHHAHRRRGRHGGEHPGLVRGRGSLRGDGVQADHEGAGGGRRL